MTGNTTEDGVRLERARAGEKNAALRAGVSRFVVAFWQRYAKRERLVTLVERSGASPELAAYLRRALEQTKADWTALRARHRNQQRDLREAEKMRREEGRWRSDLLEVLYRTPPAWKLPPRFPIEVDLTPWQERADEMHAWCWKTYGRRGPLHGWTCMRRTKGPRSKGIRSPTRLVFLFRDKDRAMLFKLSHCVYRNDRMA